MSVSNVLLMAACVGGPFLILGIVFIIVAVNTRRKAAASRGWPTAPGAVASASVEESMSSDDDSPSTSYHPRIVYSYQVGGVNYQSHRLSFDPVRSGSRRSAEKALEAYPAGKAVVVHYNPANPSEAVLAAETGGSNIFLIVGIILVVIALMIACAAAVIAVFAINTN